MPRNHQLFDVARRPRFLPQSLALCVALASATTQAAEPADLNRFGEPPRQASYGERAAGAVLPAQHTQPAESQTPPPNTASRADAPRRAKDGRRILRPRADRSKPLGEDSQGNNKRAPDSHGLLPSITQIAGALAVVLGLFFLLMWLVRRGLPKSAGLLPSEVVDVLGRAPLASRQTVHLVRVGNKLLLVSISAAGAETLTEITDPAEVDRLLGLCTQQSERSATSAFRQVMQQFSREPAAEGFIGEPYHDATVGEKSDG